MRKILRLFFILVAISLHAILLAVVNYSLPSYETTRVTGVEVKRVDKDGPISKSNPADGPVRDVYYIYTQKPDSDKPMVYRNEDTRWGYPFYFKFGSADLQAKAQGFSVDSKNVEIKYYGWRLVMFDEYRNAISINEIDETHSPSNPIFSYVLYVILLLSLFFSIQLIRGWFDSE